MIRFFIPPRVRTPKGGSAISNRLSSLREVCQRNCYVHPKEVLHAPKIWNRCRFFFVLVLDQDDWDNWRGAHFLSQIAKCPGEKKSKHAPESLEIWRILILDIVIISPWGESRNYCFPRFFYPSIIIKYFYILRAQCLLSILNN